MLLNCLKLQPTSYQPSLRYSLMMKFFVHGWAQIIYSELFKGLQQTYGKSYEAFMLSKLIPVVGDISESNLGLGDALVDFIANEVDIIVNSAANTTFDERHVISPFFLLQPLGYMDPLIMSSTGKLLCLAEKRGIGKAMHGALPLIKRQ